MFSDTLIEMKLFWSYIDIFQRNLHDNDPNILFVVERAMFFMGLFCLKVASDKEPNSLFNKKMDMK